MKKTGQKLLALGMALGLGVMTTGCGENAIWQETGKTVVKAEKLTADVKIQEFESYDKFDLSFTTGTMRFSTDLLKESVALSGPQNVMISPTSVQMALAIAANGADGETLSEMQKLLTGSKENLEGIDMDALNQYLEAYAAMLTGDENVSMNNANSIWIRDDEERFQVNEEYLNRIAAFQAEAYKAPFDDSTLSDINNWVKENTNDMIPSILNRIPEKAILYIVNAIAFEGSWEEEFLEGSVQEGEFTNSIGNVEKVQMMYGQEAMYLENEKVTGFVKPYKGEKYAYVALLPKEGTVDSYVLGMEDDELLGLLQNIQYTDVNIAMPKYKSEYDIELNQALMNLGMRKAFTSEADFSKLGTSQNPLCISEVKHKTFIEVDEKGTKAAAATVIGVKECAAVIEEPKTVVLDRPFVYAIVDMNTRLPIFFGVLNSVETESGTIEGAEEFTPTVAEVEDSHSHQVYEGNNVVDHEDLGYCGNTVTTVSNQTMNSETEAWEHSFWGGKSVALTDLLRYLNYSEDVCRCLPEYTVDTEFGTGYGINLTEGYVRYQDGQAQLTSEQLELIQEIVDWIEAGAPEE